MRDADGECRPFEESFATGGYSLNALTHTLPLSLPPEPTPGGLARIVARLGAVSYKLGRLGYLNMHYVGVYTWQECWK